MKKCNALNVMIVVSSIFLIILLAALIIIRPITINLQTCQEIFGCTPQEFLNSKSDSNGETKALGRFAYVDMRGNLVLLLTRKQCNAWVEELQQYIYNAESINNIDVSDDCSKITIYGYEETLEEDLAKATQLTYRMQLIRLMKSGNTSYESILLDGITGEVVMTMHVDNNGNKSSDVNRDHKFSSISEKSE